MSGRSRSAGWAALAATSLLLALAAGPAAGSTIEAGQSISIQGEADSDTIVMSGTTTNVTVVDTGAGGATAGIGCSQVDLTTVNCPVAPGDSPFQFFNVFLDDGVDAFTNENLDLPGSIGNFGTTGSKTINAGPGSQGISGGSDSDAIDGGDGDDFLFDGANEDSPTGGDDVLIGGPGEDEAEYDRAGNASLTVTLDAIANDGVAGEADNVQVENVVGGFGNDTIVGDGAPNELIGSAGADTVLGLAGNDRLFGDFANGGGIAARGLVSTVPINDTLDGGPGRDEVDCGSGFDLALHDLFDDLAPNCERIGASLASESAALKGKKQNKAKVRIECPAAEVDPCSGRLVLTVGGKTVAKGKFNVAAGATKQAKVKLTKKGLKAVENAGGALLASVDVITTEPGGVAETGGRVLLYQ